MKRMDAPVKLCVLILALACCWRMFGAPVTYNDFQGVKMHFWQARILLPQRVERMLGLWMTYSAADKTQQVMTEEKGTGELITVYLTQEERLVQMSPEGYVCGVVAAEMPAQYHMEALKAQVVAARTRLLWQIQQGGCALHPGADICTDSSHCQGYATLEECRSKWNESYSAYRDRILQAQRETEGRWIAYDNQPITVLYHAISGGRTENVETVFAQALPYLVSVESADEENVRGYQEQTTLSFEEITQRINASLGLELTAEDVRRTFSIGGYTESGRVKNVQIGQTQVDATHFRQMLGLRSTWFSISMDDNGITFHQRGFGHGVGMSQAGANSMAASGADYQQILQHYYTGVSIMNE